MRNCTLAAILTVGLSSFTLAHQETTSKVTKIEEISIPAPTEYQFSRTVRTGSLQIVSKGKDGKEVKTYEITMVGPKAVLKRLVRSEKIAPTPKVIMMSRTGVESSRHGLRFRATRVLTMVATGYDTSAASNGGWAGKTKMGIPAGYGIVAIDPRVIKLGTMVYVEGYGFAIAADTGGAIKGNRIDLCYPDSREANAVGRRKVKVHIFDSVQKSPRTGR